MAFARIKKTTGFSGNQVPLVAIGAARNGKNGSQSYLGLNLAARKMLGSPQALALDWDDEEYLLRLSVAPIDDPDAYAVGRSHGRISVTKVLRELRIDTTETRHLELHSWTRTSITISLADIPTASITRRAS